MRFILPLALLAGAVLSVPAMAQDTAAPAAKPAKPKRICRVDPSLGSMMPRYVCHSKEEWAALDKATQDAADGQQNGMNSLGSGTSRSGTPSM